MTALGTATADNMQITPSTVSNKPILVLYSLYWVFWGGVQKKEVKKGKIVVTDVQASTAACI